MIDPSSVATIPDAGALEGNADALTSRAGDVKLTADSCVSDWAGMAGAYSAPEQGIVHGAMDSVVTIADRVFAGAATTAGALRIYAAELAMLATRRNALIDDILRHNSSPQVCLADPIDEAERSAAVSAERASLLARVTSFAVAAQQADADCASALGRLSTQAANPYPTTASGIVGGGMLGLGAEVLERYRKILVPGPNFQVPNDLRIDSNVLQFRGGSWSTSPSGLLVPAGSLPLLDPKGAQFTGFSAKGSLTATPDSVFAPTAPGQASWMKWGGRSLGIGGAGLTVWSEYSAQYNSDQAAHPEWTEGHLQANAVTNAAVVGGTSAALAWGGAVGGAKVGAVIGTFFGPGPGTLIGGIVGGVVGGVVGGIVGTHVGKSGKNAWEEIFG